MKKNLLSIIFALISTLGFSQAPNYVPANGLVGWWPFNGNADDESGNGNNGTVNGATLTSDRNGVANQAYSFDGVGDYINVINPTILNFNIGISFTVSFFYNAGNIVTNSSGFNGIIARQSNNNGPINGWQIGRDINNYRLEGPQIGIDGCGTNTLSSVDFNQWVHIVQVYDRVNGIVTTYKNSSLVNQIFCTPILSSMSNNYDLKFGVERENTHYSSGKLDDIGIWNRALTPQEITNLYTSTVPVSCLPAYVPTSGLVGYWPFCGNANDESGNGNNGTVNGATLTTDRNGVANQAYSFDGIDDYISILRNYQGSFTTSIWFNSNGNSQYKPLIDAFDVNWEIQIMNSFLAYVSFDNSSNIQVFNSSILITNNNWNNLICTFNSNILNFYLNGNQIDQFTVNTLPINSGNYFLGASLTGSAQYFEGKLDDIGIWNRALTQQEITNLYTSTVPVSCLPAYVPTSGLVGYWPFCGNADDESGNGNNGTVNGATLTTDRNGVANQAYNFDGYNDFISINDNQTLNVSNVTVSAWYNAVDYGSAQQEFQGHIASKRESSGWGTSFQLALENSTPNHTIWATYTIAGNGWAYYSSNSVLTSQNWIHVTYTHDNTSAKIFINGILVNTTLISGGLQINNLPLWFGARPNAGGNSAFFNGKLDDIGIWNRALTDCEIQNLYNSSNPTNTTTASACNSYVWNGTTYTQSGVYTGTTANCVTESLNLTITPSSTNTTTASACNSYTWNGQTYTQSGVYTGTTANCVTESLNLTITPSSTNTTTASACDSYVWNGTTYTQSGVYTGTTANCVTESLDLTITPSSTNTTTATACDTYTWNGTTYTASGVYTGTTTNCVTESLNLTITPSSTNTTTAAACNSYTWNGTTYTSSGVYTGTTANCVTQALNLTIIPNSTNTTTATACDSYTWNGTTYTATGVYTGTTANCVTQALNLTITPSSTNTTTVSACNNYTWNGQAYTQSGVYTGTTANCVTQALNLTINTNTSSSISQTALDTYTWPVNNQAYTTTGAYTAVIPNASGCDSTITLNLTMSFTGINDLSASKLTIYPNPTNGDFTITGLELVGTVSSLTLTDMNGKVVKVLDTKATKFSMASIKPGVYFLNIISGNKQEVLKIVKE